MSCAYLDDLEAAAEVRVGPGAPRDVHRPRGRELELSHVLQRRAGAEGVRLDVPRRARAGRPAGPRLHEPAADVHTWIAKKDAA